MVVVLDLCTLRCCCVFQVMAEVMGAEAALVRIQIRQRHARNKHRAQHGAASW